MNERDRPKSTKLSTREKAILSGLYLSRFDSIGLKALGFESFVEAFNVIGFALGSRPASIKNYRDEFDPLCSTRRKGWHKRKTRDYCLAVFEDFKGLDFASFTGLVGSFFGYDENTDSEIRGSEPQLETTSSFAQRLITGLAAERYFESRQPTIPEFTGYSIENTTRLGCGFDYRLWPEERDDAFLAIEVKGLKDQAGTISMTPKEYGVAGDLKDRFYLFVVRNFRESPHHAIIQNPLASSLKFKKSERVIIQTSWLTSLGLVE